MERAWRAGGEDGFGWPGALGGPIVCISAAALSLFALLVCLPPSPVQYVSAAGVPFAWLFMRHGTPPLIPAAAVLTAVWFLGDGRPQSSAWFLPLLLLGEVMVRGGWIRGLLVGLASLTILWVQFGLHPEIGWFGWHAGLVMVFLVGLALQRQSRLLHDLRAAQAELATKAAAEERNRIARELHDVIAHSMTVAMLHVTGARMAIEHEPAEAARALAEAERLGRESLAEIRRAVGILKDGGEGDGGRAAPLPSAGDLRKLVAEHCSAGAMVELRVDGDLARVPGAVGLALYRIVQESLTNAARHAPGYPTTVSVAAAPERIGAVVVSHGPAKPDAGGGHGLIGMRERAELLGGTLDAGPCPEGWIVGTSIPLTPVAA